MHNAFRDGHVHLCASKCSTCIFRPGNLMHLNEGRRNSMVQESIQNQSAIICHQSLDGDNAVCRGFWDVHQRDVGVLQVAERLNVVREVEIEKEGGNEAD